MPSRAAGLPRRAASALYTFIRLQSSKYGYFSQKKEQKKQAAQAFTGAALVYNMQGNHPLCPYSTTHRPHSQAFSHIFARYAAISTPTAHNEEPRPGRTLGRGWWGLHLSSCTVLRIISSTYHTIARIVTTLVGVLFLMTEMPPPAAPCRQTGGGRIISPCISHRQAQNIQAAEAHHLGGLKMIMRTRDPSRGKASPPYSEIQPHHHPKVKKIPTLWRDTAQYPPPPRKKSPALGRALS